MRQTKGLNLIESNNAFFNIKGNEKAMKRDLGCAEGLSGTGLWRLLGGCGWIEGWLVDFN